MSLLLMEKIVDDIADYLEANLPAKLDAFEASYADGIALADIKAYYIAEQLSVPEYPAMFVMGDSLTASDQGTGWVNGVHSVIVSCLATSQDSETLKRTLYRYARAVIELAKAAIATLQVKIDIASVNYSPTYGKDAGFLSDVSVVLRVTKLENLQ